LIEIRTLGVAQSPEDLVHAGDERNPRADIEAGSEQQKGRI
jgi:hypothetical protein